MFLANTLFGVAGFTQEQHANADRSIPCNGSRIRKRAEASCIRLRPRCDKRDVMRIFFI